MTNMSSLVTEYYATQAHQHDLIGRAMMVAELAHRGQTRSRAGTGAIVPYFMHLVDVCIRLARANAGAKYGQNIYAAAFLHDVLEDTTHSEALLVAEFGEALVDQVKLLTLPLEAMREPVKTPHQIAVMESLDTPNLVRAVKIADKSSNVGSLIVHAPDWPVDHIIAYAEKSKKVVESAIEYSTHCPVIKELGKAFMQEYKASVSYYQAEQP